MNQVADPVQDLIAEVRSAFETETTVGRILGRTKGCLERFLANPNSLDQIKASLCSNPKKRTSGEKQSPRLTQRGPSSLPSQSTAQ